MEGIDTLSPPAFYFIAMVAFAVVNADNAAAARAFMFFPLFLEGCFQSSVLYHLQRVYHTV
jgi:hypothetical protein